MKNLTTSFPFYSRESETTAKRRWCVGNVSFRQAAPVTRLPPFVLKNPGSGTTKIWAYNSGWNQWGDITALVTITTYTSGPDTWKVYNWEDLLAGTITSVKSSLDDVAITGDEYTWPEFVECGVTRLVYEVGATRWYSEEFVVEPSIVIGGNDPSQLGFIMLEATDGFDVGEVEYSKINFAQRIFLPVDAGRPEYTYLIDADEDGEGEPIENFMRANKSWKINFSGPEYIADALHLFRIHGSVVVVDQYGTQGVVRKIAFEATWGESDCECNISFAFERENAVKKNE